MDNGAYGCAPYRLPEKFGLADAIGRKPRCEVGACIFGQPGFPYIERTEQGFRPAVRGLFSSYGESHGSTDTIPNHNMDGVICLHLTNGGTHRKR